MEEKLKAERNGLKTALEAAARSEKEAAVSQLMLQKDRELRMLQRGWDDERSRLEREQKRLQSHLDQEVAAQVSRVQLEADQRLFEANRKHGQLAEKWQADYEALKEEMEGRMNRLRAEHAEQVEEYEGRWLASWRAKWTLFSSSRRRSRSSSLTGCQVRIFNDTQSRVSCMSLLHLFL
jgi:hypothetical protein